MALRLLAAELADNCGDLGNFEVYQNTLVAVGLAWFCSLRGMVGYILVGDTDL